MTKFQQKEAELYNWYTRWTYTGKVVIKDEKGKLSGSITNNVFSRDLT